MSRITGAITYYFPCGKTKTFPLMAGVKGLVINNSRPTYYKIQLDNQELTEVEICQFSKWILSVANCALGGSQ